MTNSQDHTPKSKDQIPKSNGVSAIVMAAGRSQRMGAFKPLLPFGPGRVVDSCIANLRAGGAEAVVVVIGQDARAEALRAHLEQAGLIIAVNPDPASEMSASIASGVRALPASTKAVLINPVDHAAVSAGVIDLLIEEWAKGARLVKPTWNERGGHPVLVDLGFRDELLNLDPQLGLKALFDFHLDQVRRVTVNSKYIARDMDTWDDYFALHLEVFGVPPPESEVREPA
ncbi:MAG TPA: nucleotidyltransferase family protein [Pyrinomonadaceae bacterium]|jgi:CTP:molybdopterin cytidylyltransferase MocA|nr:nucleotidyltransferase family protein [Pyrinomonadaceae bacterium]